MFVEMFGSALRQALPLLAVFALAFVALVVLKGRSSGAGSRPASFPYVRRPGLFTEAESKFLRALRAAVPDLDVFGKVRLEDVVEVRRGLSEGERASARNRIKSRHLDFVLTDPASTRIVCVVELDDRSHATKRSMRSDEVKEGALAAAGVPLLRVPVRASYDVEELKGRVAAALNPEPLAAGPRPRGRM